jgi:hypothetical protein
MNMEMDKLRGRHGLTLPPAFAAVQPGSVQRWPSGDSPPCLNLLCQECQLLGMTLTPGLVTTTTQAIQNTALAIAPGTGHHRPARSGHFQWRSRHAPRRFLERLRGCPIGRCAVLRILRDGANVLLAWPDP